MPKICPYIICWVGLLTWAGYSARAIEPPIPPPADDYFSETNIERGVQIIEKQPINSSKQQEIKWNGDIGSVFLFAFMAGILGFLIGLPVGAEHIARVILRKNTVSSKTFDEWDKEMWEFINSIGTKS